MSGVEYVPALGTGAALAAIAAARTQALAQERSEIVSYELRFPKELPPEAVENFLQGWTGTLPPAWKRWATGVPFLIIETRARPGAISHHLLVALRWSHIVESLLTAHLPSVRYRREDGPTQLKLSHGIEYRSNTNLRALAVDAAALSIGLLSSLQPLRDSERLVTQYVVGPHAPVAPPQVQNGHGKTWWANDPAFVDTSEAATALRRKQTSALLIGVGRLGVRTDSYQRARTLLRRAEASWSGARAPGIHLRRRLIPKTTVARRINRRIVPVVAWPGGAINVQEAAGLIGWPVGIEQLPGLRLGGCRLLPVSQAIPNAGTVIGTGTFPSTRRPVAVDGEARLRHLLVTGPTGTGKSVFLSNLASSDLSDHDRSVVVIDPKDGSLVDRILEAMPASRQGDVIVFDPSDDRTVGFNPIACTPETRELVVDQVVSIMAAVWKSSWGPRSSDLIRHALLTLTQVPGMTLVEAPRLLTDATFRRHVLAQVDDPLVTGSFWQWFDGLSEAERSAIVAPPMNKLRALTSRESVRHAIGQTTPAINFQQILNSRGVLLVRLSSGLLGDETASLLGALITAQLWQAIAARAALPHDQRPPAMVTIDEVQSVLRMPVDTIENMLTQARGYGVGVTLAHQHLQQLPADVREAALSNTRSKVIFATSQRDASTFAKELGSSLTADDLREIEAHEAVASVFAAGRTQPPTTISVPPPPARLRDARVIRELSRRRFGVDRADVEAAIRARQQVGQDGPVGRKRRGAA